MRLHLFCIFVLIHAATGQIPFEEAHWEDTDSYSCMILTASVMEETVTSPSFPDKYPNDATQCVKIINPNSDEAMFMKFDIFELEGKDGFSCSADYMVMFANDFTNPQLGFCGNNNPGFITIANGVNIVIFFHSDASLTYAGYSFRYSTESNFDQEEPVCIKLMADTDTNHLYSPGWPQYYPNANYTCWEIHAPVVGDIIYINFIFIDVQIHDNTDYCVNDQLQIRDGSAKASTLLMGVCGDQVPDEVHTTSNMAHVVFKSDNAITHPGFDLTYSTVAQQTLSCTTMAANSTFRNITTPNYPDHYPADSDICWGLYGDYTATLELRVFMSELELSPSCIFDYVKVRDGLYEYSPLVTEWCGTDLPNVIFSSANKLNVRFHSDENSEFKGFKIGYRLFHESCTGLTATGSAQKLISPGYPGHYDSGISTCVTIGTFNQNNRIEIEVSMLKTEKDNDVLAINDGVSEGSPIMALWSGTIAPGVTLVSSGPALFLRFSSDAGTEYEGYVLKYKTVQYDFIDMCVTHYATEHYNIIQSPTYPHNYLPNTEICWVILTPVGDYYLVFMIIDLELESSDDCINDFLEIRDGKTGASPSLGRWCLPQIYIQVVTSSVAAYLYFKSNDLLQYGGFKIQYYATIYDDDDDDDMPMPSSEGSLSSTVAIIIGCLAAVIVLLAAILLVYCCYVKKARKPPTPPSTGPVAAHITLPIQPIAQEDPPPHSTPNEPYQGGMHPLTASVASLALPPKSSLTVHRRMPPPVPVYYQGLVANDNMGVDNKACDDDDDDDDDYADTDIPRAEAGAYDSTEDINTYALIKGI